MVLLKLSRPYRWASRFKRDRRREAGSCKEEEFAEALKLWTLNGIRDWMFPEGLLREHREDFVYAPWALQVSEQVKRKRDRKVGSHT
jgi:hypothetical protein